MTPIAGGIMVCRDLFLCRVHRARDFYEHFKPSRPDLIRVAIPEEAGNQEQR